MKPIPMLYRILAQTETFSVKAVTKRAVTEKEAVADAKKHILHPDTVAAGGYRPFVVLPLGTEDEWKYGHINYCPRCGAYIGEDFATTERDMANNEQEFECSSCDATVYVNISRTVEDLGG
ncbi:hypothetical protein GOP56_22870 [Brevibacillus sp. 7WMA2]|uniref:hypothetical protein n=1 Tax=Brevibacillus sp. 7WMA2 TaxID=2683193 RepID=UPI0013A73DFF|nr:hypothetical protein [Brevibacillus sp. 7WMA2]QIC08186.1 hypothetical protein GOP56_22870 [Brevibacillus sp. 7WMA2]